MELPPTKTLIMGGLHPGMYWCACSCSLIELALSVKVQKSFTNHEVFFLIPSCLFKE